MEKFFSILSLLSGSRKVRQSLSSLRDSGLKSGSHKGIQARSDDGAVAKATVSFPRMR